MDWRAIDWIWHIRGSVPLPPGQSSHEAFDRLDPLFRVRDTYHDRRGDELTFSKSNQAPQDKMATFDGGTLRIERDGTGAVLRFDLHSRILLFCFLAPLLFLAFAGLNIAIGVLDPPTAAEKAEAKKKQEERMKRIAEQPLHPIDQFLGAPAPEKPKSEEEENEDEDEDEGPSNTPAYVFAALFAVLYVGGHVLEHWLIRSEFRKRLWNDEPPVGDTRVGPAL